MSPRSFDELAPHSVYSEVLPTHSSQPMDGPPMLERKARGRERGEFSGSMRAIRVNETTLNDEKLVALVRKLLCLDLFGDIVVIDKAESIASEKQVLDPSICGVIIRKHSGQSRVMISDTGEVLKIETCSRLGGPNGVGNMVLVAKKPNKTAFIYGTPAVRYFRRITLQRDFELFEDTAVNWETIEEAAKIDYEFENFAKEEAEARERGRKSDAERRRRAKEFDMGAGHSQSKAY